MAALEQITGVVSKIGEKGGFQLREYPGTWYRPSDYANPKPVMPIVGLVVRLDLDARGFVHIITALDDAPEASTPPSSSPASAPSRETTILRLSVLKSAAHVAAARPTMDRAAMLELASALETWVTR